MDIRAAEISSILKSQIANFGAEAQVTEVGQVLSRRRRHRARLWSRQGPGRRNGRVRERRARDGAKPRERQRRHRHFRRRPRNQGRPDGQAHRRDRRRADWQGAAWPRRRRARQSDRRQGPDQRREARPRRRQGARHHSPQVGQRADGDRTEGDRRDDPDRPRPARADHRRPADRQDRDRARHHLEPEAAEPERRRIEETLLRLCRGRTETFDGRAIRQSAGGERRARIFDHRRRHRLRSRTCSSSPPSPAARWANSSATTACTR